MQLIDVSLKKSDILSPSQYVELFLSNPTCIEDVSMLLPQLGKDNNFGSFKVTYSTEIL